MTYEIEKETLKLFADRTERMLRSRLVQNVLAQELSCKMEWRVGEGMKIDCSGCDEDDRDAFVLSLRLFIQNNDRISIFNIAQIVEGLPLSDTIKVPFREQRVALNQYLDSAPFFRAGATPESYRQLLYAIVYGDLSHFDPKLRPMLQRWMADPLVWPHMQAQFLMVCRNIVLCLSVLRTLVQMALDEI